MNNKLPLISCKCTTYGRIHLLEEALHSFLIQDYKGPKELVIVNDYPLQKIIFDHPEVKIINLDKTFNILGEKENLAVAQCSGDIIAVWDDDDIALPNHLSNIAKYFKEDTNMLHWGNGGYYNYPTLTSIVNIGNDGMVYSKKVWGEVGKHPLENAGGDSTFSESVHKLGMDKVVYAYPPFNEVSWFYMWGGRSYHQSGLGYDIPGRPNIIQRHSEHIENLRESGQIPTGNIMINPHWNQDYIKMLRDYVSTQQGV